MIERCLVILFLIFFSSCVTASKSEVKRAKKAQTCLELFGDLQKKRALFIGFGSAATLRSADEASRADLAMQIRTKVEGRFSSLKSNETSSFSIFTSSVFSEVLLGIVVNKRCPKKSGGYEVIVTLTKELFLKNISNILTHEFGQVDEHLSVVRETKDEATKIRALLKAREFLKKKTDHITANYHLCKTYSGCESFTINNLRQLAREVSSSFKSRQFKWRKLDKMSAKLTPELAGLLAKQSIMVSNSPSTRRLDSTCWTKVYEKTASHKYMFVDLTCRVGGFVDDVMVFSYDFGARGQGESQSEATRFATRQMELVK